MPNPEVSQAVEKPAKTPEALKAELLDLKSRVTSAAQALGVNDFATDTEHQTGFIMMTIEMLLARLGKGNFPEGHIGLLDEIRNSVAGLEAKAAVIKARKSASPFAGIKNWLNRSLQAIGVE